jgi:hypothetical protein
MANPTCTTTVWVENAADYTQHFINTKQQKCLELHAMALELAAIGGTDYTADLTALITAAEELAGFMSCDQITAANVSICYANAAEAGALVPAATNDKIAAIKELVLYDDERLKRAWTLLRCKLGRAEAYEQT